MIIHCALLLFAKRNSQAIPDLDLNMLNYESGGLTLHKNEEKLAHNVPDTK